jgi:thiol:disulfide interchange protein
MFSAWWCTPCREFKRTVLTDSRVQAALADVAFVDLNVDGENGSAATR